MDILNNSNSFEILIQTSRTLSFKRIVVIVIREKSLNHLTIEYLDRNGKITNTIKPNIYDKSAIFSVGDYLIYDGISLYKLEKNKIVSLANTKQSFLISSETIKIVKEATQILNQKILNFQNKNVPKIIRQKIINPNFKIN